MRLRAGLHLVDQCVHELCARQVCDRARQLQQPFFPEAFIAASGVGLEQTVGQQYQPGSGREFDLVGGPVTFEQAQRRRAPR